MSTSTVSLFLVLERMGGSFTLGSVSSVSPLLTLELNVLQSPLVCEVNYQLIVFLTPIIVGLSADR